MSIVSSLPLCKAESEFVEAALEFEGCSMILRRKRNKNGLTTTVNLVGPENQIQRL